MWLKYKKNNQVYYKINTDHPVINKNINLITDNPKKIKNLFHVLESSLPYKPIIMDNNEVEDCFDNWESDINPPSEELLKLCSEFYFSKIEEGYTKKRKKYVLSIEPFNTNRNYLIYLEKIDELND